MKIFAFCFSCKRDEDLCDLMVDTLIANAIPMIEQIRIKNTDDTDYKNGAGWKASMMKLQGLRDMLSDYNIGDGDLILSVDSDVVFTSPEVFQCLDQRYGIIGTISDQPWVTRHGVWGHCSGALIFIRGDIAKKMAALEKHRLDKIRIEDFKAYDITENEDVVLSYLAMICGAEAMNLPSRLSSGNFEFDVTHDALKSFYHLNYCPTEFMGEKVSGKWGIPAVLRRKGIEL